MRNFAVGKKGNEYTWYTVYYISNAVHFRFHGNDMELPPPPVSVYTMHDNAECCGTFAVISTIPTLMAHTPHSERKSSIIFVAN